MALAARVGALAIAIAALLTLSAGSANAGGAVNIDIGDFYFCNPSFEGGVCETVIDVGDTVQWNVVGQGPHTTTECGSDCDNPTGSPLWDSGQLASSETFQYTFNTSGTYLYHCEIHPTLMMGRIVVQGGAAPTDTPQATSPGGATAPAGPTATTSAGALPTTGAASGGDSSSGLWVLVIGLVGAAMAAAGLGVMAYRRNGSG